MDKEETVLFTDKSVVETKPVERRNILNTIRDDSRDRGLGGVRRVVFEKAGLKSSKIWDDLSRQTLTEGRLLVLRTQEEPTIPTGPAPGSVIIPEVGMKTYLPHETTGGGFVYAFEPEKLGPVFLGDAMTWVGDDTPNDQWLGGSRDRASYTTVSGVNIHHDSRIKSVRPETIIKNKGLPENEGVVRFGDHTETIVEFSGDADRPRVVAIFNPNRADKWDKVANELGVGVIESLPS